MQLRNAQVQHAVLGALQTDPEFSYLADAAGAVRSCLHSLLINNHRALFPRGHSAATRQRLSVVKLSPAVAGLQAECGCCLHP